MDIIGNEVTQRIRAAITNKLKEVGVYVDDELPDYIMVMVANKKSKEQMMSDLMLFLGTSTKSFTIWLHELLDNLQATTSVETAKPDLAAPKDEEMAVNPEPPKLLEVTQKEATPPPVSIEEENEEVLTFQTELETDDILMQELQKEDLLLEAQKAPEKKSNKISLRSLSSTKPPEKPDAPTKTSVKVRPIFHRKTTPLSVQCPTRSYDKYLSSDDEDGENKYDPRNPSVASVVRVSQRKSSVPRALQANKLLLFKAMEDANKSVTHAHRRTPAVHVEPYEPTPISRLTRPAPSATQQVAMKQVSPLPGDSLSVLEESVFDEKEFEEPAVESDCRSILIPVTSSKIPLMPAKRKLTDSSTQQETAPKNPRFVVTLDGVDPSEFLSSRSLRSVVSQRDVGSDDHDMNDEEEEASFAYEGKDSQPVEMEPEEEEPPKKARLQVRCTKWPACSFGDACRFHHPRVHCKMFPNCSFGNKCLYIHPNCKYDAFCKKRNCPFTHAGKRKPLPQPVPICVAEVLPVTSAVVCKFHPDCFNPNCTFYHPKNCKFGLQCKNSACQFTHPVASSIAPPHQLKWTAPKGSLSGRKFSLPTSEHFPVSIDK